MIPTWNLHFPCCPSPLQHSPGLDNVTCNQNFSFSCSTDIYISGGPWIFMMLLYDDVYCQSNCLSVPGCQVLRGVIHNNNRAKLSLDTGPGTSRNLSEILANSPPIIGLRPSPSSGPHLHTRSMAWLHSGGRFTSSAVLIFKRWSGFTSDEGIQHHSYTHLWKTS